MVTTVQQKHMRSFVKPNQLRIRDYGFGLPLLKPDTYLTLFCTFFSAALTSILPSRTRVS